ncbi:serine--tRNA ligase [Kaistia dalseonensis]|uniref:Serine--tRNA ligase n=1 Tax=Kaistia dalseonensis TaxID=410840 RepID=A0ABU0H1J2_9HYPH|nr:serine--tRNA ligase [Kaistia dalseonensis]MCX5493600.1 serine--tRNA ligase [Kaistia dalseonensis]MDQ0436161.1 seryl-tRNA synthetase [Kaistia dalseonensis]
MLDIKWIRENPAALDRALMHRSASPLAEAILGIDEERRAHIQKVQAAQERRNAASKEIGKAKGAKDEETAARLMAEVSEIKEFLAHAEEKERELNKQLDDLLATTPNVPLDDVPVGKDEHDNVEKSLSGQKRLYSFEPKEHFEIGVSAKLMDFETAAKLSGSRFVVLKGQMARMERAIGQFMLDLHTNQHGYLEVQPPLLVKDPALFGTGQLPKFKDDLFSVYRGVSWQEQYERNIDLARAQVGPSTTIVGAAIPEGPVLDQHWLIPTAEVPLTNLIRESILDEKELPLRFTALTPCFRSEAGSAGRDTRGMLRQHQFNKVELVSITTPETSIGEHERMLSCAEEVLKRLDLHYRVVTLCTGDMGFGSQKTYDIEVWLPGQKAYREISSVSVCGDFQARRMDARYRPVEGKGTRFVHTLNGSGTAVGRALIAVLENYQNEDGSVTVPSALQPYMGGLEKIGV